MLTLDPNTLANPIARNVVAAAEAVVNSGAADPAEVEQFVRELLAPQPVAINLARPAANVFNAAPSPMAYGAASFDAAPPLPPEDRRGRIELPEGYEFSPWQDAIVGAALMLIPIVGIVVAAARAVTAVADVTVGVGPQITAGAGIGVSLGGGVLISNRGRLGGYGSIGGLVGAMASISATLQVTITGGGVERFRGWAWGAGIAGGELLVGNAAVLLTMTSPVQFLGVTVGVGVGYGIPLEVFVNAQHTWAGMLPA